MIFFSKNIIKTIIRDLYHRKTRSLIILISVSLIIIFPVAFISSGSSLLLSLDNESEKTQLSHLEIFFISIPESTVDQIKNITNPEEIEGRIRLQGILEKEIEDGENKEIFILSMPESGTPKVNIPKMRKGSYTGYSGSCAVLESYAIALNIHLGDIIVVKAENGSLPLTVTGLVTSSEFASYEILGQGVVYVNYDDAARLGGYETDIPVKLYNNVVISFGYDKEITNKFLKEQVSNIEKELISDFDFTNDPLFIFFTQKSSVRAALADGTELVGRYLGAASTFTVLITGFVVFIIMNRYINEEKKLIGVYHSFGFSKIEIIYIYSGRALLLALGGIVLGSILAIVTLNAIVTSIGNLWAISEISLVTPIDIFLSFWILSLLCTLVFAIIPVIQAANLNPYEALREIRKIGVPGRGMLSRIASYLHSIPKMSIRTLARNRVRTILTVFAIIGSMALSIALLSTFSSVNYTVENYFEENLVFDAKSDYYTFQNNTELEHIRNQTGVKYVEPQFELLSNPVHDVSEVISIRGFIKNTKNFVIDPIELHPNFIELGSSNTSNHALLSQRIARRINVTIGDVFTIKWKPGGIQFPNLTLKVMGLVRDFEYSIGVYVGLPFLQAHLQDPSNYFTSLTLKLDSKYITSFVQEQQKRYEVRFVYQINDLKEKADKVVNSQIFVVSLTVILGFLIALISVFNTQYISIAERERDISIMQAFGYSRRFFLFEFLVEIIILVPISLFLATILSRPITQIFLDLIEGVVVKIDYFIGEGEIMISLIFVFIVAISAAVIPALFLVNSKKLAKILKADE
ncbi:MAG: hypothetical protein HeimC3_29280 [Candidatus Heimdallarchaeota archaeon LC_3]|nr:MAG: hypothetical protein HeimC3_29280 [Candidatus Heimdallarchaeota archaeon LC_3]